MNQILQSLNEIASICNQLSQSEQSNASRLAQIQQAEQHSAQQLQHSAQLCHQAAQQMQQVISGSQFSGMSNYGTVHPSGYGTAFGSWSNVPVNTGQTGFGGQYGGTSQFRSAGNYGGASQYGAGQQMTSSWAHIPINTTFNPSMQQGGGMGMGSNFYGSEQSGHPVFNTNKDLNQ